MDDRMKRKGPGTSRLNPPARQVEQGPPPQEKAFSVRLNPSAKTGEFDFVIDGPDEVTKKVPAVGLTAEASGMIPPELHRAVDEVLGFIYNLDAQFENRRKPR